LRSAKGKSRGSGRFGEEKSEGVYIRWGTRPVRPITRCLLLRKRGKRQGTFGGGHLGGGLAEKSKLDRPIPAATGKEKKKELYSAESIAGETKKEVPTALPTNPGKGEKKNVFNSNVSTTIFRPTARPTSPKGKGGGGERLKKLPVGVIIAT